MQAKSIQVEMLDAVFVVSIQARMYMKYSCLQTSQPENKYAVAPTLPYFYQNFDFSLIGPCDTVSCASP